jgi:hypothetical protein
MRHMLIGPGPSGPYGQDAPGLDCVEVRFLFQYGAEVCNLSNNSYVLDFLLVSAHSPEFL